MTKINSKQCRKCQEVKPLTEFNKQSATKDGLQVYCRECNSQQLKDRKGTLDLKASTALRNARQKAKKYSAVDTLTLAEVREIFSADSCDYCNAHLEQSEKTIEHVIPFEYGGANTFGNVTLACAACNKRKHVTPAFEFILLNGDANAARRLLYTLAERNSIEPQAYLYELARAGIQYRTARLYRIAGVDL